MLDIGKLILSIMRMMQSSSFSSMLDIGKLILKRYFLSRTGSFSSMLDIGKLIRKYPIGYWLDSGGDA